MFHGVCSGGSWDEMREVEYADLGVVAPRADRPELVSRLKARGLPNTTIADTAGVTERQVRRDLSSTGHLSGSGATVTNSRGQQRPATYQRREPEVVDAEIVGPLVGDPCVP